MTLSIRPTELEISTAVIQLSAVANKPARRNRAV